MTVRPGARASGVGAEFVALFRHDQTDLEDTSMWTTDRKMKEGVVGLACAVTIASGFLGGSAQAAVTAIGVGAFSAGATVETFEGILGVDPTVTQFDAVGYMPVTRSVRNMRSGCKLGTLSPWRWACVRVGLPILLGRPYALLRRP